MFGTGLLNEYQLAGSGAIKNVNFYLSGNVFTNEGVVKNSDYRRYAFHGNLNRQFNSRFGMNLTYRASRQSIRNNLENYLGNSLIYKGINIEPGFNATPDSFLLKKKRLYYNPDVSDFDPSGSLSILSNTTLNLDSLLQHTKKQEITSQAMNVSGMAKFSSNLSLAFLLAGSYRMYHNTANNAGSSFLSDHEAIYLLNQQYDLKWATRRDEHRLFVRGTYSRYVDGTWWQVDSTQNIEIDGISKTRDTYIKGSQAIYGMDGSAVRKISSFIGRLDYRYRNKYSITGLLNYSTLKNGVNGSVSKLFPSVDMKWHISRERVLNNLKVLDYFYLLPIGYTRELSLKQPEQ